MKYIFVALILTASIFSAFAQEVKYANADTAWNADELGNQRVVLEVSQRSQSVKARIDWRRRDKDPQDKNIIVSDETGATLKNVTRGEINREHGEIFFEPISGAGKYYVYFLPYKKSGSANYPKDFYPKFEETADSNWLKSAKINPSDAKVVEFQSIDAFNSFYPMDIIATKAETDSLISKNPDKTFLLFPEDRMFSVRMTDDLPQRWIEKGLQNSFAGESRRGEFYAFQLGVYALKNLKNVKVNFTDLTGTAGKIMANNLICINTSGVDYRGQNFEKTIDVEKGKVQAIWCGIDVAANVSAGAYKGTAAISADGEAAQKIALNIKVINEIAPNSGFNEPEKMTRLKWLNSRLAQENTVIKPYTPIIVKRNEISILGRKISLGFDGLPKMIQTFFTPEMTSISKTPKDILLAPIQLKIDDASGKSVSWKYNQLRFTKKELGSIEWQNSMISPDLQMNVEGRAEFDGFISYQIKLTAKKDVALKDVRLEMPFNPEAAKYMMGLGEKGGKRRADFSWKWDVANKNQEARGSAMLMPGCSFRCATRNMCAR